eukprot:snap_masked-scaffold_115-processed-gene-0.4-mRNA-1 protein AED:0.66 eAED:0.69 QI:0/-1/0/1/-1/1/1/0/207
MKEILRKATKQNLRNLSNEYIRVQSEKLFHNFKKIEGVDKFSTFSIYLAMEKEAQTNLILDWLNASKKTVFVPKLIGGKEKVMIMVKISKDTVFKPSTWGIPEPQFLEESKTEDDSNSVECVLVPCVLLTSSFDRLGHGKGHYDKYLLDLFRQRDKLELPKPRLIGLCLDEQLVDPGSFPTEAHDMKLDCIVTPTKTLFSQEELISK